MKQYFYYYYYCYFVSIIIARHDIPKYENIEIFNEDPSKRRLFVYFTCNFPILTFPC